MINLLECSCNALTWCAAVVHLLQNTCASFTCPAGLIRSGALLPAAGVAPSFRTCCVSDVMDFYMQTFVINASTYTSHKGWAAAAAEA